jgi:hypothetical protein
MDHSKLRTYSFLVPGGFDAAGASGAAALFRVEIAFGNFN